MAYTKTSWKDRIVQNPLTYTMRNNADGTVTLIPAEGIITQSGTPITADNLNHLETQYDEVAKIAQMFKISNDDGTNHLIDVFSAGTTFDFNTLTTPGEHFVRASAWANQPTTTNYWHVKVTKSQYGSNIRYVQRATADNGNGTFERIYNGSTWGVWKKVITDDVLTPVWSTIPLQNGVQVYSTGTDLKVTKVGNLVTVKGQFKNILTMLTTVGNIPVGMRPPEAVAYSAPTSLYGSTGRIARWTLGMNGDLVMQFTSDSQTRAEDWYPIYFSYYV